MCAQHPESKPISKSPKQESQSQNSQSQSNVPEKLPPSFLEATKNLTNIEELRATYEHFLQTKDDQIEMLKRENLILLRTAIKRRNDEQPPT